MKCISGAYRTIAWFAVSAWCFSAEIAVGNEPAPSIATPVSAADCQVTIRDVALLPGGLVSGQVLDASTRPAAGAAVAIYVADTLLATTRTDASGAFAVTGLRSGMHQIVTPHGSVICRFWAPGTAPPSATDHLQIVDGQTIVRGQAGPPFQDEFFPHAKAIATHPLVVGGLLAAAIAIPVSLNNADEQPGS